MSCSQVTIECMGLGLDEIDNIAYLNFFQGQCVIKVHD